MINSLLGIKKTMTSTYDARGRRVGATVVEVQPNFVTQVKTPESKDGYGAVQLGLGVKKSVNKSQIGHTKKAGLEQKIRYLRESRLNELTDVKSGQEIKVTDVFSTGDSVKVTGVSKGKGFAGGMKRHGFSGGPKTHGQSDRWRAPGSIGSGTTPGRVYRGKKMAGHMGVETVSVRNMEIVGVDKLKNLLIIKGGIPGSTGSLLKIQKLGRIKGYIPPPEEKIDEEEEQQEAAGEKQAEAAVENQPGEVVEEVTEKSEENKNG